MKPREIDGERYLTARQAGIENKMTRREIYRLVNEGTVRAYRFGRMIWVNAAQVQAAKSAAVVTELRRDRADLQTA